MYLHVFTRACTFVGFWPGCDYLYSLSFAVATGRLGAAGRVRVLGYVSSPVLQPNCLYVQSFRMSLRTM